MLPDFKPYHKATVVKRMLGFSPWIGELKFQELRGQKRKRESVWDQKQKHIHTWKRTDSLEIKSCLCGQLIYNQGAKYIQWRKDSLLKK